MIRQPSTFCFDIGCTGPKGVIVRYVFEGFCILPDSIHSVTNPRLQNLKTFKWSPPKDTMLNKLYNSDNSDLKKK